MQKKILQFTEYINEDEPKYQTDDWFMSRTPVTTEFDDEKDFVDSFEQSVSEGAVIRELREIEA